MPRSSFTLLLAALVSCLSTTRPSPAMPPPSPGAGSEPTLHIGDPAPELDIEAWVRGEPLARIEPGRVHLVVFWSSWSKPSMRAVKPLAELGSKHADALTILAVNVAEPRGLAAVRAFADGEGDRLSFRVGYDRNGRTDRAWVWASGWAEKEMPTFFVIDRNGKLAWIGRGVTRAAGVVERMLAGGFDPVKEAAEEAAAEARARESAEKAGEIRARLARASATGDVEGALKAIDELTALDPESEGGTAITRFNLLVEAGHAAKAAGYAAQVIDGPVKDDPIALNDIAWTLLTDDAMPKDSLPAAMKAAARASELTKHQDPMILDTLAMAYSKSGDKVRALDTQKKAVERIPADWDEETRDELKQRLAEYEKAAK